MAKICVVGLWHQASVVSACLADMGHLVCGVGDNSQAVEALNAAHPPVHEPGLSTILRRNLRSGRLRYSADYREALAEADFAYIAIDTPVGQDDEPDPTEILEAAHRIGQAMSGKLTLIVSAQVPVGTCERLATIVRDKGGDALAGVAYVPEFLRLGTAVETFRRADRFVVGADSAVVAERVADLYRPLQRPIIITDLRTAEMIKHASNAFLALSISFINEIANLCDEVGADVMQVGRAMKLDRRIGKYAFMSPGLGFAGGTLGREVRTLQKLGADSHCPTPMMDATMAVNQARAWLVSRRLLRIYPSLQGLRIGILGLTYKAGTSTLRRAISLEVIRDLNAKGAQVRAFDPLANLAEIADLQHFEWCSDPYTVAEGSDALVLVTEWAGIHELDLARLQATMRRPVFIDTRNIFDPAAMTEAGFIYSGVGRMGWSKIHEGTGL